jgi:hypothetical protein
MYICFLGIQEKMSIKVTYLETDSSILPRYSEHFFNTGFLHKFAKKEPGYFRKLFISFAC